jgi:hypothetical protein
VAIGVQGFHEVRALAHGDKLAFGRPRDTRVSGIAGSSVYWPKAAIGWPRNAPCAVLDKFAAVQMIDVFVPTTDGRELSLTRYTQPEPELKLLLNKLTLTLPAQAPPKITTAELARATPM